MRVVWTAGLYWYASFDTITGKAFVTDHLGWANDSLAHGGLSNRLARSCWLYRGRVRSVRLAPVRTLSAALSLLLRLDGRVPIGCHSAGCHPEGPERYNQFAWLGSSRASGKGSDWSVRDKSPPESRDHGALATPSGAAGRERLYPSIFGRKLYIAAARTSSARTGKGILCAL